MTGDSFLLELEVRVREIVAEDLAGLREWYGPVRDDSFRRSYERHQTGEVIYLVADMRGRPVGHLGVDLVREPGAVLLWQFGVLPALQSMGIGSRMMEMAENGARVRGHRIAEIRAETDNPRARALYERLGYEHVGEIDGEWVLRKDL